MQLCKYATGTYTTVLQTHFQFRKIEFCNFDVLLCFPFMKNKLSIDKETKTRQRNSHISVALCSSILHTTTDSLCVGLCCSKIQIFMTSAGFT